MPLNVTHPYVSTVAEGGNSGTPGGDVGPSEWNAAHNITGNLPVTQLNSGTNASSTTFWRGDGTWALAGAGIAYYISAVGSDSNNGLSPLTPFQTITKVNTIVPGPGTTFLFRGGDTFSGTLVVAASGAPGQPVTYTSYDTGILGTATANATISSGANDGLDGTNVDNILVQNLTFLGNGTTNNGIHFSNPAVDCNNYTFTNLTISGYQTAIKMDGGHAGAAPPNTLFTFMNNVTVIGCTFHDCSSFGFWGNTNNDIHLIGDVPYFHSFNNFFFDHCTIFNLPSGNGISINGINGYIVQNCIIHDTGYGSSGGPGVYCQNGINILWQFNECYQIHTLSGHDGVALYCDGDTHNILVQYNYCHDCDQNPFGLTTLSYTLADSSILHANCSNAVFRYNIAVACGSATLPPSGIDLTSLLSGETITNSVIYNNTFISGTQSTSFNVYGLIGQNQGHSGSAQVICANNILVANPLGSLINVFSAGIKFIGNILFGGNAIPVNGGVSVATWITNAAAANSSQESIDGLQVNPTAVITADPLLLGGNSSSSQGTFNLAAQQLATPPNWWSQPGGAFAYAATSAFGPIANQSTQMQLSPMSAVSRLGVDLTATLPMQVYMPYNGELGGGIYQNDFDFKGGVYKGSVGLADIACSRTSTAATDLTASSPIGASYTTFGANTLRITSGRGLLVEGARTNYMTTPVNPTTQTTASIPDNSSLVLWVNGPGSATVTAGTSAVPGSPAIVATQGRPSTNFNNIGTGTLTVTITGTLYAAQLEGAALNGNITSFIATQSLRDADVVTTSTATNFGDSLQKTLNGAQGGAAGVAGATIWYHFPTGTPNGLPCYLATDNAVTSAIFVPTNTGQNRTEGIAEAQLSINGNVITAPSAGQPGANAKNAVSYFTTPTQQNICLNGGGVATGNVSTQPTMTSPMHLGNRPAADAPINGYIERILIHWTPNSTSQTLLPIYSSITPIVTPTIGPYDSRITRDFFGNPVSYNGYVGIGAHQSTTAGGTVILNGATPVTVADKNVTATAIIFFTLNTVGGTVGAVPSIKTITPGTGFTVAGTALDTSTYNYIIIG